MNYEYKSIKHIVNKLPRRHRVFIKKIAQVALLDHFKNIKKLAWNDYLDKSEKPLCIELLAFLPTLNHYWYLQYFLLLLPDFWEKCSMNKEYFLIPAPYSEEYKYLLIKKRALSWESLEKHKNRSDKQFEDFLLKLNYFSPYARAYYEINPELDENGELVIRNDYADIVRKAGYSEEYLKRLKKRHGYDKSVMDKKRKLSLRKKFVKAFLGNNENNYKEARGATRKLGLTI